MLLTVGGLISRELKVVFSKFYSVGDPMAYQVTMFPRHSNRTKDENAVWKRKKKCNPCTE